MENKMLEYLNKIKKTHTISQIADMCGYKYHTIFKILKLQSISEKQATKCFLNLYDGIECSLKELEMIGHKPLPVKQ